MTSVKVKAGAVAPCVWIARDIGAGWISSIAYLTFARTVCMTVSICCPNANCTLVLLSPLRLSTLKCIIDCLKFDAWRRQLCAHMSMIILMALTLNLD